MPLAGPIGAGVYVDGELVNAANLASRIYAVINAIRNVVNPKTSIWHGVVNASGNTINDSTFTDAPLDAVDVDSDGIGITQNGYLAPINGIYLASGFTEYTSSVVGFRCISRLAVNASGAGLDGARCALDSSGVSATRVPTGSTLIILNKGDLVTVQGWQNSQAVTSNPTLPFGHCALTVRRYA